MPTGASSLRHVEAGTGTHPDSRVKTQPARHAGRVPRDGYVPHLCGRAEYSWGWSEFPACGQMPQDRPSLSCWRADGPRHPGLAGLGTPGERPGPLTGSAEALERDSVGMPGAAALARDTNGSSAHLMRPA